MEQIGPYPVTEESEIVESGRVDSPTRFDRQSGG